MTNSYLVDVIKTLQPNERQEFAWFLTSPHFNRGGNAQELTRLYQIIFDASPDFSEHLLKKDKVYFQVFSDSNLVAGKLEKLMADLNKLLRSYAVTQQYLSERNELQHQIDWAKWLRERGLAERSRHVMSKLGAQKQEGIAESLETYRTQYLIAEEKYFWEGTHNQLKGDLGIPELIYGLELYYQSYLTELSNRYLIQQKGPQLPDLVWDTVGDDFWQQESTLLRVSKGINQILRKGLPTVSEFLDLMNLVRSEAEAFNFHTLAQYYAYLRNFCTLLIDGGNLEFIPILHEIHKDNLERKFFYINGGISPNVYLNLVQVATRAKEVEWAKKFTEDYKNLLIGDDEGHFFYHVNMAQCLFVEGKFEDALAILPDTPSGTYYHHMIRRLELKIYYEIQSDLLLYKIDAFRKYVERTAPKAIASNYREMDLNFLNILLQLAQSPMKDKVRSAKLVERIESKKLIADRAWLLEKAKEMG